MKIATWNVNSIRARLDRVTEWLSDRSPHVVCLQETKVEDKTFPLSEIKEAGYEIAFFGQKTYNGVAVLSRDPITDVQKNFGDGGDDSQARFLDVKTAGIRILTCYVPNGKSVESPDFAYKLTWLKRLQTYLETKCSPDEPLLLCGDMNVAPAELDVYDPVLWEGKVHFHPEERAALDRLQSWGMKDAVRMHHPETQVFSWWDYRRLGFPKNRGLRIDHIYLTESLVDRCTEAFVDREARKGQKPSDHAPVIVSLGEAKGEPS